MKVRFDFEVFEPPALDEQKLAALEEEKRYRVQIRLLRIASLISIILMAIFSFYIYRDSVILTVCAVALLWSMIIANGLLTVYLRYKNGFEKGWTR